MTFQNKTIVIAGGTSGIGLASALGFKDRGAKVIVTGRKKEKLDAAIAAGLQAEFVDSSDRASLDQFFARLGKIDHLVVSVSGGKGLGEFATLSLATLKEAFDEKFFSHLDTVQAAL